MSVHIGHRDALLMINEQRVYVRIGRKITEHYVEVTVVAGDTKGWRKGSQHVFARAHLIPRKRGAHARPRAWWHVWG